MLTCSLRCTIARIFSGKCAKSRVFSGKCAKSRIFSERAHTRRQRGLACALSRQKTHKNRRFTLPLQSGIINRQYKPAMRLERRRFVREPVSAMRARARWGVRAKACVREPAQAALARRAERGSEEFRAVMGCRGGIRRTKAQYLRLIAGGWERTTVNSMLRCRRAVRMQATDSVCLAAMKDGQKMMRSDWLP